MLQKRHALTALTLCAMILAGCARIGPGGAAPGFIYSNVTYPNLLNPNMEYRIVFDREDIELLGVVEATAPSRWVAFVFSSGDSGYGELMKKARAMGADGVMNVTIDTNFQWYFLLYAKVTTKLTGVAYRYRRLEKAPSAEDHSPQ